MTEGLPHLHKNCFYAKAKDQMKELPMITAILSFSMKLKI